MRCFFGSAVVAQMASVGGNKIWKKLVKANIKCKRGTERSDWHARVSDSVTQRKSVGNLKECDEKLRKKVGGVVGGRKTRCFVKVGNSLIRARD